jgi:hypothetical protein
MEFADLQKRPQKAREQPTWTSLQSNDSEQETVIPGYGSSYGENVPGLRVFSAYELATSGSSREDGEARAGASKDAPKDVGGKKDTRIAQGFAGESGVQWDPVSELFKVIVGGAIIGVKSTLDAASDLYQQVMKSTHDHGGGKNSQHGKGENQPSREKQLEEYERKLEELKRTQGPKKDKEQLRDKIEKIKKSMAKDKKGTAHNNNAKGSNGQSKR